MPYTIENTIVAFQIPRASNKIFRRISQNNEERWGQFGKTANRFADAEKRFVATTEKKNLISQSKNEAN